MAQLSCSFGLRSTSATIKMFTVQIHDYNWWFKDESSKCIYLVHHFSYDTYQASRQCYHTCTYASFSHSATNLHHRQIHKIIRNPNWTNTCDMLGTTNTCCLWKLPKTRENKRAACFNSQEVVLEVDVHKHTFSSNIAVTCFSANDSFCCRN